MPSFPNIVTPGFSSQKRVSQRTIRPTSIKGRQVAQTLISNTSTSVTPASVADGAGITVTVRSTSTLDPKTRLTASPFMIAVFEAAHLSAIVPGTNQIPYDVANGRWDIYSMSMPGYEVDDKHYYTSTGTGNDVYFATNGDDIVTRTSLENNSGGALDIIILIQLRTIQSRGGQS